MAWVNTTTGRALREQAAARVRYKETGRTLDNGGCIGDPQIVVDQCLVFLCILHQGSATDPLPRPDRRLVGLGGCA